MSRRKTHPQFDSDEYIRRIEKARAEYLKKHEESNHTEIPPTQKERDTQ